MVVKWLDEPEAHDFDAAADYLSLVGDPDVVEKTVVALRSAESACRKATRLSVNLLVRGIAIQGARLQIADGYHGVCASYVTDENTPIPCRLVSWRA
jgi:hypothetical protein